MSKRRKPPSIKFYEEKRADLSRPGTLKLTRMVRWCSFGLIKSDTQAGFIIVLLLVIATAWAVFFIRENKTLTPTVQYELLPQESIGSKQGVPNSQQAQYE